MKALLRHNSATVYRFLLLNWPQVKTAEELIPPETRTAVGQTFCEDRDTLAALLMAGVLASSPDDVTTEGCQTMPEGAQVQVLERYPRAFDLFRTVKVQVTTPAMPAPKIGYTIEISR